jgi:hypothetical protein
MALPIHVSGEREQGIGIKALFRWQAMRPRLQSQ